MHHKPSQRRILIQRAIVYTLMSAVVVSATIVLFFLMLGYRFNPEQGEFEQGGLAQFITRPTGASVTVGKAHLAARTPSKITLNPGTYDVRMELDGYRPWLKTVSIDAGQVLWLNSVRFVPLNPSTEAVGNLDGFGSMVSRLKGNKIYIIEDKTRPTISIFDIGSQNVTKTTVAIPAAAYTAGKKHSFSLESMSTSDRYVILVHNHDKKTERIAVDVRDPERSFVLRDATKADFTKVMFDPRASDHIYGKTAAGNVSRVDLATAEATSKLLSSVQDFSFADDSLLLYTASLERGLVSTGALRLSDNEIFPLGTLKTKEKVLLAGGYYYNKLYIGTSVGSKLTINLVKDLSKDTNTKNQAVIHTEKLSKAPSRLTSETKGRFFLSEQPDGFHIYDVELRAPTFTKPTGKRSSTQPVQWLDEYHYSYEAAGRLQFSEFDGSNIHELAGVTATSGAVLSSSGRYLYTVGIQDKKFQLQRTILIVR